MELQMKIQLDPWKFRWKFSLEIIDGNLVGNFDPWKFGSLEIQFQNLEWKFSLEMIVGNLDGNLVGSLEIQMEIQFGSY